MLYIGETKVTGDKRFELLKGPLPGDLTLRLTFIEATDAGLYECQISTSPKRSKIFKLNVVGMYVSSLINELKKLSFFSVV